MEDITKIEEVASATVVEAEGQTKAVVSNANEGKSKDEKPVLFGKAKGLKDYDIFAMKQIYNKLKATKKIKWDDDEVQSCLITIFEAIKVFNHLPKDVEQVWGKSLDKIQIPEEFKAFIFPLEVKLDLSDFKCENVKAMVVVEDVPEKTQDYIKFREACQTLRQYWKMDGDSKMVPLSGCLTSREYTGCAKQCSYGGQVLASDEVFIPIPVDAALLKVFWKSTKKKETVKDKIADWVEVNFHA